MGKGIISVSTNVFEKLDALEDGINYVPPKQPETLAEWHSMLMLPEEYHLLGATLSKEFHDQVWEILVENSAIPEVVGKLTEVSPIYRVDFNQEDGTSKNYLDRIEINRYAPDMQVIWQAPKEH